MSEDAANVTVTETTLPPSPRADAGRYAMAPAPGAPPAPAMANALREDAPLFDVSVFNGSFATEFSVPQSVDVPSNGQRVAMALGHHEDTARLAVRTSPRVDASAFLVADMAQPAGVWPAGALQLYRDGAFVGTGQWNTARDARVVLSFGRDELVRVEAEPERDSQGSGGFVGTRAERRVQRAYTIENRHRMPMAVQIIEASPVSIDEQVRVTTLFSPQPAETAWKQQPGVTLWELDLAAGKNARVAADYTITYPKDARLQER
ncbi:MAG: mucoidy inhibitor MuiA family protein [Comamonadaceae bacterium]|nr:MAG: mucoidy inhibitor MuiA family protein [Comamonadaceae bacterium]